MRAIIYNFALNDSTPSEIHNLIRINKIFYLLLCHAFSGATYHPAIRFPL